MGWRSSALVVAKCHVCLDLRSKLSGQIDPSQTFVRLPTRRASGELSAGFDGPDERYLSRVSVGSRRALYEDSPLDAAGFEPSVPRKQGRHTAATATAVWRNAGRSHF